MSGRDYTIRRADGEEIMGEYSFMVCGGPDDWEQAVLDAEFGESPTEYVIERWEKAGEWTRTFGEPAPDEDDGDEPVA